MGTKIITGIRIAGAVATIALALLFARERNIRIKAEESRDREQLNVFNLLNSQQHYEHLMVTAKEAMKMKDLKIDSQTKALGIKPTQLIRIQKEIQTVHDTIPKLIPVERTGPATWKISDSGQCWSWKATARLQDDSLRIQRTDYRNDNEITNTFYRVRPHRFLCIKYGKWINTMKSTSKCGDTKMTEIEFIKE
jgi:hypothetical protein